MADQPLRGLTIAVTRPSDQAAQLAQRIEQAGGKPLLFPLLEITPAQDFKTLHEQVERLARFDLAIFISPNAVRFGVAAIRQAGPLPQSLKIATIGQGSAQALRELGISRVIAPARRFDSEALLDLPELQDVAGWNVMIFRGDGGRELLGDMLKARGATVEYATCYRRSKPQQDVQVLLDAWPDAITVTSSEALGHLGQMLDTCPEPSRRDKGKNVLRDMPLFAPHARIAELAKQQGWKQVHLTGSGDDGLISALITWAQQRTED